MISLFYLFVFNQCYKFKFKLHFELAHCHAHNPFHRRDRFSLIYRAMEPEFSLLNSAWSSIKATSDKVSPPDASLQSYPDSASDNETSERPVRERLEKASIASVPKDGSVNSTTGIEANKDNSFGHVNPAVQSRHTPSFAQSCELSANGYHARGKRNQSYDDLAMSGKQEIYAGDIEAERNHTLTRKKSADFHFSYGKEINRLEPTGEAENLAYDESSLDLDAAANASQIFVARLGSGKLPSLHSDSDDRDKGFAVFGPRKKRSRDQLDADIDREQKIVATEEAKAQRRSEEQERDTLEAVAVPEVETQRCMDSMSPQSEERGSGTFSSTNPQGVSILLQILWESDVDLLSCRSFILVMLLLPQNLLMH